MEEAFRDYIHTSAGEKRMEQERKIKARRPAVAGPLSDMAAVRK